MNAFNINKFKNYHIIHDNLKEIEVINNSLSAINYYCIDFSILGKEFLIKYQKFDKHYDLIIYYFYMPLMDCFGFINEFRKLSQEMPIIIISHGYDLEIHKKIEAIEMVFYCPTEPALLNESILEVIKNKKLSNTSHIYNHWQNITDLFNLSSLDRKESKIKLKQFELNLLQLLAEDKDNWEIAKSLKASLSHVTHTKHKLTKQFGLKNPRMLMAYSVMFEYVKP